MRPILIDLLSTIVFFILLWTTHDFTLAAALGIAAGVIEVAVMPSEIEQLPDLQGYLKLASRPEWLRVAMRPD